MSFPTYAEYKESGVKWLGSIPSHWEVVQSRRLFRARRETAKEDDVMLTASQKYGMIPQSEFVEKEGRRVVEVIQGKENLIHVEPDDFVISMRSFQGGLEWCRYTGSTSFHYVPVTPIKNVVPSFFAHLLKSAPYISALRSTTNLIRDGQEIRYSNFVQAPLPLVPKQEQLAIASFLDRETAKIDALIAEQQRLIELLQEKRQAVISHAVTKGLNPNAPMKDSGVEWLGEVPEHWELSKLSKLTTKIGDGLHGTPEYVEESEFYFVNGNNLNDGAIVFSESTRRVCKRELEKHWVELNNTTLLMSINGTIGNFALYRAEPIMLGKSASYINCNERISREYLGWIVQSFGARCYFVLFSSGTTISNLGLGAIKSMPVAVPPLEEQVSINDYLANFSVEYDRLVHEAELAVGLLQERRSALISAAVTGQIDVRGLEQEVAV